MFCDISVEAEMAIRKSLTTAGAGVLGGAVGLALLGTTCSASVLDYTGYTVTGDSITIDTPILTSGVAGLIHLITPSGTVDAWCLDVYDMLSGSGTYNVGPVHPPLPGVPILTAAQIGEIGALMVHGDDLVAAPPPGDSANDVATAIAVAIWSVEYGTTFTFNYVDSTVATLAPLYYSDAISGAWAPFVGYSALSYTNDQTLTSNQTVFAVISEPSTWAMMLLGLGGLGLVGYRTSRKARSIAA
jgi:PEP-CTERM motif